MTCRRRPHGTRLQAALHTVMCRPHYTRLQAALHTVAGRMPYGCRPHAIRLQAALPTVAGRITYGCMPRYIRLQVGGLLLDNARTLRAFRRAAFGLQREDSVGSMYVNRPGARPATVCKTTCNRM